MGARIVNKAAQLSGVRAALNPEPRQRPYWFLLRDGQGGGTYLTDAPGVVEARDELVRIYGERILFVAEVGGGAP